MSSGDRHLTPWAGSTFDRFEQRSRDAAGNARFPADEDYSVNPVGGQRRDPYQDLLDPMLGHQRGDVMAGSQDPQPADDVSLFQWVVVDKPHGMARGTLVA